MNQFIERTYNIKNYSIEHLKHLGFYYNKEFSDKCNKYYSTRFPVMKYNDHVSIEGEFTVDISSGSVQINVYGPKGNKYAPFYNNEYGDHNDILSLINKNIGKYIRKYKVKKLR